MVSYKEELASLDEESFTPPPSSQISLRRRASPMYSDVWHQSEKRSADSFFRTPTVLSAMATLAPPMIADCDAEAYGTYDAAKPHV